jgi:hypothetical protein
MNEGSNQIKSNLGNQQWSGDHDDENSTQGLDATWRQYTAGSKRLQLVNVTRNSGKF